MVRKFRIYLSKKFEVENSSLLALKRANFLLKLIDRLLDEQFVIHRIMTYCEFGYVSQSNYVLDIDKMSCNATDEPKVEASSH
jgi:hypothetical protein